MADLNNTNVAPYPVELAYLVGGRAYRPGWTVSMDHLDRGQGEVGTAEDQHTTFRGELKETP